MKLVKLDSGTILDMDNGTVYEYGERLVITFNGPQKDQRTTGKTAAELWRWLCDASLKFSETS